MERARESRLSLQGERSARSNRRLRSREPKKASTKARRRESDRHDGAGKGLAGLAGDRREIVAVLLLAAALVSGIALFSWDPASAHNLIGRAGAWLARHLFGIFGIGAFVLPVSLFLGFLGLVRPEGKQPGLVVSAAWLAVLAGLAIFVELVAPSALFYGARPAGELGGAAADLLRRVFSTVGSAILVLAGLAVALVVAAGVKWSRIALVAGAAARKLGALIVAFVRAQIEQHRLEREERLAEEAAAEAEARAEQQALAAAAFDAALGDLEADIAEAKARKKGRRKDEPGLEADLDGRVPLPAAEEPRPEVVIAPAAPPPPEKQAEKPLEKPKKERKKPRSEAEEAPLVPAVPLIPADPAWASGPVPVPTGKPVELAAPVAEAAPAPVVEDFAPAIVAAPAHVQAPAEPEPAEDPAANLPPAAVNALVKAGKLQPVIDLPKAPPKPKKDSPFELIASEDGFSLPPLALLQGGHEEAKPEIDEALLHSTAEKLRQKLADFGIQGHVERIRPGPVVTMYEFAPAPGVKISKIAGLSDDLAMALEALRVRIVAPIPGRGVVGIEVPNKKREIVYLREILEQDAFRKGASKLTMALGKDIEGMPFVADLAKMPHLLISGTTGSGKSVSVNSMIMSLLFKATPEEVRFIMVDPKMLELSIYEGIPHLLLPVVTDPRKAALALRWAVDEMERRYALLAENGVRDLASFNKLMGEKIKEREARGAESPPAANVRIIDVQPGETEDEALERVQGEADAVEPPLDPVEAFLEKKIEEELEPRKLPYLVIIIDELADLMMVASKEVETYIARIAQKARAAGIHLMVATQRPSVDVVTGLIKANFPSRVSFLLRSQIDSRTILDTPGAEKLLGQGDMLILPPTSAHIQRVHGALVTEKEIKLVVDHLKAQGTPVYDESILKAPEEESDGGMPEDDLSDELYDQAIAIVSEMKTVSISMLQRKMRIGYNRSARMIERMERDGIVGHADGAKPREVLIRKVGEMPGA